MTAYELMEGLNEAQKALAEARENELEKGAVTAISYATLEVEYEISDTNLVLHITTRNTAFSGDREEVRYGFLEGWEIRWNRYDIGVTTGEDFMPPEIREWLLGHTRAE